MQIVINKSYFDNIKVAIDAMNNFFASGFKTKAFPVINNDFQLDRILSRTLSWLNNIEPSWVDDPNKAIETLNTLKEIVSKETPSTPEPTTEAVEEAPADPTNPWVKIISGEDKTASDMFHAFIGFKVLQYITNNFDKYEQLLNGVYSFELFTKPSAYRDAITTFTSPIPMPELDAIAKLPGEYKLFDASDYVNSIFENDQIKLPEEMNSDTEIQRFQSFGDLQDCEIVINDSVQEAADVNYFTSEVENIKYSNGKWKISKGFESQINTLLTNLRKCETTEDLIATFQSIKLKPELFANTVAPAILVRVLSNPKKYPSSTEGMFSNYTRSYTSIVKKNAGAVRFERIDLFSTFKTDKEGTIQFLEDFLKLNLVNDERVVISNNTLLTVFNIFDSHIYFTILYNMLSDKEKEKESSLDGFIKRIRSRINQNSRSANPYQKKKEVKQTIEGSDQVTEYALETMKELGDLSIADMQYCEQFAGAVYDDIDTIGDALYNKGVSAVMIDHYIGESYSLFMKEEDFYQEGFFDNMKAKNRQKKIDLIEKKYGRKLPDDLIQFIDNPPKHGKLIKYTKGKGGFLGIVFGINDIYGIIQYTEFGAGVLLKHDLVMFAEWYKDQSDPNRCIDDVDPEDIGCLYLNLKDNSIMYSQNPFEKSVSINDFEPFEKSIQSLCEHLEDWPGKPDFSKTNTIQEAAENGEIPNYLKERVGISDELPKKPVKQKSRISNNIEDDDDDIEVPEYMKNRMDSAGDIDLSVTEVNLPPDVPSNDVEDLADSIDARLNTKADSLGDMLGADYKGNIKPGSQGGPGTVIYNITNNYTNSHNTTTTNDLSTNKRTNTSTVTTNSNDLSSNKRTNTGGRIKPSNNYDNTRPSSNSKESDTFSTGKSVQEVFALLDSKEPLFVESDAGKPPKGDMLTTAMDVDRASLPVQQKVKHGVQKVMNTGRAIKKPITRTKQWLRNMTDSLIKRDEDRVKADLVSNPSYRSALYKAARLALKTGKFALFSAISPWLGAGYLGMQGLKLADRDRLRKEANQEILTEIQILDEKIDHLKSGGRWGEKQSEEDRQELYKLMRMRQKLLDMSTAAHRQKVASSRSVY